MQKKGGESGRGVWMHEPRPSRADELLQKEREKYAEKERRAYALRWHRVIFSLDLGQRINLVGELKRILKYNTSLASIDELQSTEVFLENITLKEKECRPSSAKSPWEVSVGSFF